MYSIVWLLVRPVLCCVEVLDIGLHVVVLYTTEITACSYNQQSHCIASNLQHCHTLFSLRIILFLLSVQLNFCVNHIIIQIKLLF